MRVKNQDNFIYQQPNLVYHSSYINPSYMIGFQQPQQLNLAFIYQNNIGSELGYTGFPHMSWPYQFPIVESFQNYVPNKQDQVIQKNDRSIFFSQTQEQILIIKSTIQQKQKFVQQLKGQTKNEHKIRKKYKQNGQRNVLTNIGNQLLTFLGSRKKSQSIFKLINNKISQQQINQFYEFIHKLRKRKKSPIYFNQDKLMQIWFPKNIKLAMSKNFKLLRQMSLIFIQKYLPLFMLNSVRIKKQTKLFHISTARKLLHLLRYQQAM